MYEAVLGLIIFFQLHIQNLCSLYSHVHSPDSVVVHVTFDEFMSFCTQPTVADLGYFESGVELSVAGVARA